jgi:hypothetical protein
VERSEATTAGSGTASVLAVSREGCSKCHGSGIESHGRICGCSLRRMFRTCLTRYLAERAALGEFGCPFRLELSAKKAGFLGGLKAAEYCADFESVVKRVLGSSRHRGLLDDSKCALTGESPRWRIYHEKSKLRERLGRALADAGLYPPAEYFAGREISARDLPRSAKKEGGR